mmetsp:Transcript_21896/g.32783  ORF Transcript_21896/g.32783 Transcript_21896/m.32783 type:complete len:353 (-) Transcript_21896:13-1071(-)
MATKKRLKGIQKAQKNIHPHAKKKVDNNDDDKQQRILVPSLERNAKTLTLFIALLSIGMYLLAQDFSKNQGNVINQDNDQTEVDTDYAELNEPEAPKLSKETIFLGDDSYEVLEVLQHDRKAFTQGLTLYNGYLYEGTGLHGSSEMRKLDPSNPSTVIQSHSLPSKYFGEGITFYKDRKNNPRIIQLTWKEKTAFVYDADSLELIKEFEYETTTGEGWGISFLPETCELVVSDGSQFLSFWDCESFVEKRKVEVRYYQNKLERSVARLNELEVVKLDQEYAILANVWFEDVLLHINPVSGDVDKVYLFHSLYTGREGNEDVFNGISVSDDDNRTVYLTGKLWPFMYKVKLKQ